MAVLEAKTLHLAAGAMQHRKGAAVCQRVCPINANYQGDAFDAKDTSSDPVSISAALAYFIRNLYKYELSNMTKFINSTHINWHILIPMSDVISVAK